MPQNKKKHTKGSFKSAYDYVTGIPRRIRNTFFYNLGESQRLFKKHIPSISNTYERIIHSFKTGNLEISNGELKLLLIAAITLFTLFHTLLAATDYSLKLVSMVLFPILIFTFPLGITSRIFSTCDFISGVMFSSFIYQVLPILELSIQQKRNAKETINTASGVHIISVCTQLFINFLPINIITQCMTAISCSLLILSFIKTLKNQSLLMKNILKSDIPIENSPHRSIHRSNEDLIATPVLYFGMLLVNSMLITQCITFILPAYTAPRIILNTLTNWMPTIKMLIILSLTSKFIDNINPNFDTITFDFQNFKNSSFLKQLKPMMLAHILPTVQCSKKIFKNPLQMINHLFN